MLHKNVLKKPKHPNLFPKGLQIRYFIETGIKNGPNFFSFLIINNIISSKPITAAY